MHPLNDGQTLARSDFEALFGGKVRPLSESVFDDVDLSGLDLNGLRFERYSFKGAGCTGPHLENSRFVGCRGAI